MESKSNSDASSDSPVIPLSILEKEDEKDAQWDQFSGPIPLSESLLIAISSIPSLSSKVFVSSNYFINFHRALSITNLLSTSLQESEEKCLEGLKKVNTFLGMGVPSDLTYRRGPIESKESQAFLWRSPTLSAPIQIGIPSETIKVSMRKGEGIPQAYVLPPNIFRGEDHQGEIEFPVYFNYFIKKAFQDPAKRTILIGAAEELDRVKRVFHESFYGPSLDQQFFAEEISPELLAEGYAINFPAEQQALSGEKGVQLDDFALFLPLDEEGKVSFSQLSTEGKEIEISVQRVGGLVRFWEQGKFGGSVDAAHHQLPADRSLPSIDPVLGAWEPPAFGVTYLGTSHGFDAKGNTTVDPPVYSTEYLATHGIPHSLIHKIILTHCHSDHDSGLLKRILQGQKIELLTTKTIHESYKRKMNAITGLNFGAFYHFTPVLIGKPTVIMGATFEFDYSYHTIPTLRFICEFGGRSMGYSSDMFFSPDAIRKLKEDGVINSMRESRLLQWLWSAEVVLHESGIPPIHTAIETLRQLPAAMRRKIRVVHCSSIPSTVTLPCGSVPVTDLFIPKCGLENTEVFAVSRECEGIATATRRMKLLGDVPWLPPLLPSAFSELWSRSTFRQYSAGHMLIKAGEPSKEWFVLTRGVLRVESEEKVVAWLQRGAAFGETALRKVKGLPRVASVIAATDCDVLCFAASDKKEDFPLGTDGSFEMNLNRLSRMRHFVGQVLTKTYLFQTLTEEQITFIAASLEQEVHYPKGSYIIREGDTERSLFIIEQGSVRLERASQSGSTELMHYGVGDVFGELSLITGLPRTCSVIANEDSVLLELKQHAFNNLVNRYQNLHVKLALLVEQRLQQSQSIFKDLE